MGDDDRDEKPSSPRTVLIIVAVVVAFFGGFFALERCHEDGIDAKARGKLVFAHLGALTDGRPALVLVESVLHPGGETSDTWMGRLDVIDAESGVRVARAIKVSVDDCHPATRGLAWCVERPNEKDRNERALVVRELGSLTVAVSAEKLREAVPALAMGIAGAQGPAVDADGGAAVIVTNDGVTWRIDPATGRGTEVKTPRAFDDAAPFGRSARPLQSSVTYRGTSFGFSGENRLALTTKDASGKDHVLGTATFLRPEILGPVEGEVLYVVNDDTLDRAVAQKQIAAVGLDGTVKWRAPIGKGSIIGTWRVGPNLVVAVQADDGFVIALAVADGHVVFRYDT